MKLSQIHPRWKFLSGLIVYALVVWGITLFDDYRVSVFGFGILCFITFAMALWQACSSKKSVAVILALSLALQSQAGPEPPPQNKDAVVAIVAGCAIVVVGCVIIWGVWKICKKMPAPPTKNNPPSTNEPPQDYVVNVIGQTNGPALFMPDGFGISEYNDWDTGVMKFQSSTNGNDWVEEYSATNWFNNSQYVSILYSNSVPLMTNWGSVYWTNDTIMVDFSPAMPRREDAPLKLWRAVQQ